MIVDVKPKPIGYCKVFLLDLHTGLDRLSSFDSFLDDFVDLVKIDSGLSDEIVEAYEISVPNLYGEDV